MSRSNVGSASQEGSPVSLSAPVPVSAPEVPRARGLCSRLRSSGGVAGTRWTPICARGDCGIGRGRGRVGVGISVPLHRPGLNTGFEKDQSTRGPANVPSFPDSHAED